MQIYPRSDIENVLERNQNWLYLTHVSADSITSNKCNPQQLSKHLSTPGCHPQIDMRKMCEGPTLHIWFYFTMFKMLKY
jgi:hypothetical protein